MERPLCKRDIRDAVHQYAARYDLQLQVTFDAAEASHLTEGGLSVGADLLALPDWAGYYVLYRLVRLWHQAMRPEVFSAEVRRSLNYRVGEDGVCAVRRADGWHTVDLSALHTADYWQGAAHHLPFLEEANEFAEAEAYDLMDNDCARENLHHFVYLSTATPFDARQYPALFDALDKA